MALITALIAASLVANPGKLVLGKDAGAELTLRAPEGASKHEYYDTVDVEWARRWPAEEIWKARKTG